MIVYQITNEVNGKCYIGQHYGFDLKKRWKQHLTKSNTHLHAAIKKYGPKVFSRKILAHASCQEELDLLEQFYIQIYQSTSPKYGYNLMSGGLGAPLPEESRKKIAEARRRYWTSSRKKAMARKIRQVWQNRTEDERTEIAEKMSQSMIEVRKTIPPWDKGKVGPNAGKPKRRKRSESSARHCNCTGR